MTVKLSIGDMKDFLKAANNCRGKVLMLCGDGSKRAINGGREAAEELEADFKKSKGFLTVTLSIADYRDYWDLVLCSIKD